MERNRQIADQIATTCREILRKREGPVTVADICTGGGIGHIAMLSISEYLTTEGTMTQDQEAYAYSSTK